MAKNLVLVESPSKAKTINKYLGSKYKVAATVGHIRDLPKTKLGIDVDNNYRLDLLNIRGKGDVIKKIKTEAVGSENIYIATDPDREGEAIAQDIADVIAGNTNAKIFRVLFNEITKQAVAKSMKSPIEIDSRMVESQRARRAMDRIIGYKVSPFLWKAIYEASGNSLSAGRVQTVALRLICEREDEIDSFVKTEYWSIIAGLKTKTFSDLSVKLTEADGKSIKIQPKPEMTEKDWAEFNKKNLALNNQAIVEEIVERIKQKKEFVISDINEKDSRRNPYPPFITSSLQAEASKKLRFRPKQTMKAAQSLYEGVELGSEGLTGLITYMRTDSVRLSPEIVQDSVQHIKSTYGNNYCADSTRDFSSKNKNKIQDAHEAIRPTSLKYTPEFVKDFLSEEQFKLYSLIWNRFIASQMASAIISTTTIEVKADEFTFKTSGSVVKFDGFLRVYDETKEDTPEQDETGNIPSGVKSGEKLTLNDLVSNRHFTKPPSRFTESSLIKELESNGIGRPSTYASILSLILEREYVEFFEKKLKPASLGRKVCKVLIDNFPDLFEVAYTAKMEEDLDLIAGGEAFLPQVLDKLYRPLALRLNELEETVEQVICEKCGAKMDIKIGRFGKFFACTNYPGCKNIKSFKEQKSEKAEPEYTGDKCEKCGGRTIFKNSRYGRFIGCENYPTCDFTKTITLDIKCPECKTGDIIVKKSKKGRVFYGCSRYPECKFVSWNKPNP